MKDKLLQTIKLLVFLSLGALLLWLAFRNVPLASILSELKNVNYFWIVVAGLISIFSHVLRALRWNMLIATGGYYPKTTNTIAAVLAGYLANLAVPRMGEVSRCGALSQTDKVPFDLLLGTVITERAIDLLSMLLIMGITFLLQLSILEEFFATNFFIPLQSKFGGAVGAISVGLLSLFLITGFVVFRKYQRGDIKLPAKLQKLLEGVLSGVKSIVKMDNHFLFWFYSFAIWLCYYLCAYVCFFAIDATSELGPLAGLFVLVLSGISMTAPVQGGIGVYHLLVSQGLLLYGLNEQDGLVYATITNALQTLSLLVFGALAVVYIMFQKRKLSSL